MTTQWTVVLNVGLSLAVLIHGVCRLEERKYAIGEVRLWAYAAMVGAAIGGLFAPDHWVSDALLKASVILLGLAQWNPFGIVPLYDRRRVLDRRR